MKINIIIRKAILVLVICSVLGCEKEPEPEIFPASFTLESLVADRPIDIQGRGRFSTDLLASFPLFGALRFAMCVSRPYQVDGRPRIIINLPVMFERVMGLDSVGVDYSMGYIFYTAEFDSHSQAFSSFYSHHLGIPIEQRADNIVPLILKEMKLQDDDTIYARYEHRGLHDRQTGEWPPVELVAVYRRIPDGPVCN